MLLAICIHAAGIRVFQANYFLDDAAFFFRYADHLAQGQGFRWNVGESPVWGASAPLWPALLSLFLRFGSTPEQAAIALGYVLSLSATALLCTVALRHGGAMAALFLGVFSACNFRLSFYATQGMESPLSCFLLGLGFFCLERPRSRGLLGLVAGLSLIHKLDFAVFGILLLGARWIGRRRCPWFDIAVAALAAVAFYTFAWWHFGSVLPNSFLTKLQTQYHVGHGWFLKNALYDGSRKILAICMGLWCVLVLLRRWQEPLLFLAGGFIAITVLAYTIKPPPEGFEWYLVTVQQVLCLLAALGAAAAWQRLSGIHTNALGKAGIQAAALLLVVSSCLAAERPVSRAWLSYVNNFEPERVRAGMWIDRHLPKEARVLTGFGNVAFYSHRYVYDYSYLNRPPPRLTVNELIEKYQPEVLVFTVLATPAGAEKYKGHAGYHVGQTFGEIPDKGVAHYFVVVLLRDPVQTTSR